MINDLFSIFFGPESSKYYKPLLKLNINYENRQIRQVENVDRPIDQAKVSVALGQLVQLCIHFATALGTTLKNPMIYNGNRSFIHSKETVEKRLPPLKLYIVRGDQNNLKESLALLEENLMKIYRGLHLLKERENIGFVQVNNREEDEEEFYYPNTLIKLLHKICDF